ncbi:hypothetical protein Tco_0916571 [Tanacetum coccineum]
MSHHKKTFVNPFHTKKIFANMKREGKDFSRRVTPLFDSMLVQASDECELFNSLTDSTQIPIRLIKPIYILSTQGKTKVLDLEKAKFDQAIEIASLKKRVDKLEKRRQLRTHRMMHPNDEESNILMQMVSPLYLDETQEQANEDLMNEYWISTADIGGVTAVKIDEFTLA